ncbi:hypothetical protein BHE74_00032967, partial [Ensete ventricosum]
GKQASSIATIHVKFVLCRLTKAEQRVLITLEILRFEDVIVLECTENMNAGKTYTYFSSLTTVLPHRCDYVMRPCDYFSSLLSGTVRPSPARAGTLPPGTCRAWVRAFVRPGAVDRDVGDPGERHGGTGG